MTRTNMEEGRGHFREQIRSICTKWAEKPLILEKNSSLSYSEFFGRVVLFGNVFQQNGLLEGDSIILAIENRVECLIVFVAALYHGILPIIIDKRLKTEEISLYAERSFAKKVLFPGAMCDDSRAYLDYVACLSDLGGDQIDPFSYPHNNAEDGSAVAYITLTTGTTSSPKIVEISYRNIIDTAFSMGSAYELTNNDRCLCLLPIYHASGLFRGFFIPLFCGATITLEEKFNNDNFWPIIENNSITFVQVVPSILSILLQDTSVFRDGMQKSLRYIGSASAPHPKSLIGNFEKKFGTEICVGYGMTEATCGISFDGIEKDHRRLGSVGRPLSVNRVDIVDSSGRKLPKGKIGNIVVRGTNVASVKLDFSQQIEKGDTTTLSLNTGDIGYLDPEGYLWIVGRKEDIVKRGDHRIGTAEIESAISEIVPLAEVVVLPVDSEMLGQDIVAVLSGKHENVSPRMIIKRLKLVLPGYKVPSRIIIVDKIPRKGVGKVDKDELVRRLYQSEN